MSLQAPLPRLLRLQAARHDLRGEKRYAHLKSWEKKYFVLKIRFYLCHCSPVEGRLPFLLLFPQGLGLLLNYESRAISTFCGAAQINTSCIICKSSFVTCACPTVSSSAAVPRSSSGPDSSSAVRAAEGEIHHMGSSASSSSSSPSSPTILERRGWRRFQCDKQKKIKWKRSRAALIQVGIGSCMMGEPPIYLIYSSSGSGCG